MIKNTSGKKGKLSLFKASVNHPPPRYLYSSSTSSSFVYLFYLFFRSLFFLINSSRIINFLPSLRTTNTVERWVNTNVTKGSSPIHYLLLLIFLFSFFSCCPCLNCTTHPSSSDSLEEGVTANWLTVWVRTLAHKENKKKNKEKMLSKLLYDNRRGSWDR